MKVTAMIPDDMIKEMHKYAGGKNLTQSLKLVISEWIAMKKLKILNESIKKKPFEFNNLSAKDLRERNRMRS